MEFIILLIVCGSISLAGILAIIYTPKTRKQSYLYAVVWSLAIVGGLLAVLSGIKILTSLRAVEADTIRILTLEEEPVKALTSGIHLLVDPSNTRHKYEDYNFSCKQQMSPIDETIGFGLESRTLWNVTGIISWNLICTPDNAIEAFSLINPVNGRNLQDQLFTSHIYMAASNAIERCALYTTENGIDIDSETILQHYRAAGNDCVINIINEYSDIVEISQISDWHVSMTE